MDIVFIHAFQNQFLKKCGWFRILLKISTKFANSVGLSSYNSANLILSLPLFLSLVCRFLKSLHFPVGSKTNPVRFFYIGKKREMFFCIVSIIYGKSDQLLLMFFLTYRLCSEQFFLFLRLQTQVYMDRGNPSMK